MEEYRRERREEEDGCTELQMAGAAAGIGMVGRETHSFRGEGGARRRVVTPTTATSPSHPRGGRRWFRGGDMCPFLKQGYLQPLIQITNFAPGLQQMPYDVLVYTALDPVQLGLITGIGPCRA